MKISVIAPVYNEFNLIENFIEETYSILKNNYDDFELILVDDGSIDQTRDLLSNIVHKFAGLKIIFLSRNFGKEWAITCGLEHALGDIIITMDSDLQDPPSLIPALVYKITEGFDIVHAKSKERNGENFIKKYFTYKFYALISYLSDINMPKHPGNFLSMKKKCLISLLSFKEQNRYYKMLVSYIGFKVGFIEFERPIRKRGNSKFGIIKLFTLSLDIIVSFSVKPLKIISLISLIFSLTMFIVSIWAIIQRFIYNNSAYGWASIFLVLSVAFSILFLFLFVISEYISRILIETKHRPLYIIDNIIT